MPIKLQESDFVATDLLSYEHSVSHKRIYKYSCDHVLSYLQVKVRC
jgi:hypothetical protein